MNPDPTAADHSIQALLDIIEREIRYNEEHAPQRAQYMQEALAVILEGLGKSDHSDLE